MENITISIQSKKTIIYLLSIMTVLLLFNIAVNFIYFITGHGNLLGLTPLFNFYDEKNIPTFFSAVILIFASFLLFIIYYIIKKTKGVYRFHWLFLSIIFLFLSMDEILELHEQLSSPIQRAINLLNGSLEYWGWIIPYSLLVIIFIISYLRFYLHLNKQFRILFALSALLFVTGAIGFELIEGIYLSKHISITNDFFVIRRTFPYFLMVTVEELLEMCGVILFIYSLIEYITSIPHDISLKFENLTKK